MEYTITRVDDYNSMQQNWYMKFSYNRNSRKNGFVLSYGDCHEFFKTKKEAIKKRDELMREEY